MNPSLIARRDCAILCLFLLALAWPLLAETPLNAAIPMIPPSVATISPAGMERGSTAIFKIEGRNLTDATEVIFDAPSITGMLTDITDVTEKIAPPKAGEDLGAQVPLGRKQTAMLAVTVAEAAPPGIHRFRIKTALGTSNIMSFAVGSLPEIKHAGKGAMDSSPNPQPVKLPATLIGNIAAPGDKDAYEFEGKAGAEVVFSVQASQLGSSLKSMLLLSGSSDRVIAIAGKNDKKADVELHAKLPADGKYTVSITDRDRSGGSDFFYRLDAGPLPYIRSFFPLGVRAGQASEVAVDGINLGGIRTVKIEAPASAMGWTTMPLAVVGQGVRAINQPRLAVGNEPEILEREPNNTIAQAQAITLPVTINGHIDGGGQNGGDADEDYFRFHARKGEQLSIDVAAARLGSGLDSVIEVLDANGGAIPRATIRCLNQTSMTLADRDSTTVNTRYFSTAELREGDFLMVGDELNRIDFIPDQPDADTILKGIDGRRLAYLGTSPDVHAVNTPVYKAQVLPPDSDLPSNGLPVFHLTWRNDDGGPGYGADSKLDFVAPADGEYFLHLKDVRGMEGPDFAYRLTIREARPDFQLKAEPANPNIPRGGSTFVTVTVRAIRNYEGPIEVEVRGLPQGVSATPATILPGQDSTTVILTAASDAALDSHPSPISIVGRAMVNGEELARMANKFEDREPALQLASITPPPDVVVTTDASAVSIEPGKDATVNLHVDRHNGFKGRVPCFVQNLPPGVRVVNIGLNGVLVTEAQSSRTFTLHAEEWAKPISQPIYVVGIVESNASTVHPSAPLQLTISGNNILDGLLLIRYAAYMNAPRTLQQAIQFFTDPENCRQFMIAIRWDDGQVRCPHCDSTKVTYLANAKVYRCYGDHAKQKFSLKVGTVMEDSPIGLDKWLPVMWMMVNCKNGISSYEVARAIGITQKSAWFMLHRIRTALKDGSQIKIDGDGGPIEVDETFIGGKYQNMHRAKRMKLKNGVKANQKAVVMGMLERNTRQVRAKVIPDVSRETLQNEILNQIESKSTVYTDRATGYDHLAKKDFVHDTVNHMEEYVRGQVHTQGIENFWSLLKRGLKGTYVAVEPFHLNKYVDEQVFRYNNRATKRNPLNDADRFIIALSQIAGKRLTYAELTGKVGETAV